MYCPSKAAFSTKGHASVRLIADVCHRDWQLNCLWQLMACNTSSSFCVECWSFCCVPSWSFSLRSLKQGWFVGVCKGDKRLQYSIHGFSRDMGDLSEVGLGSSGRLHRFAGSKMDIVIRRTRPWALERESLPSWLNAIFLRRKIYTCTYIIYIHIYL